MSSIPSIRVECAQCKQSFWVKLKKGKIPSVVVACPNCAYAWDLGKVPASTVVHRSYKWDEFLMKMTSLFQAKKVEDVSEEIFREAGGSGDSVEHSIADLPDIAFEHLSEISEVEVEGVKVSELGATSSEAVREPDSESIPRPHSEERSLELTALRSVEDLAKGDAQTSTKAKETARYTSIPGPAAASASKPATSEDVSIDSFLDTALMGSGAGPDPEPEPELNPEAGTATAVSESEPDEAEEVELDDDVVAAAFVELEDETIKEGELKARPQIPQLPKPTLESKKGSFGISKLALPVNKTPQLPGVSRETKTSPSRPEKPAASDDEEHPALPILNRPLERKGANELDVRSAEEQSLELMRTEDFSSELARDQADDFFKSSAQVAAQEGGETPDFADLGTPTRVSPMPLILAGLLVLMIVIAGIIALLAS